MDIKCKAHDIQTCEKHLCVFLNLFSTNIDTHVPSLYQCVETHGMVVFWLLPQPLLHLVGHHLQLANIEGISQPSCETFYTTNTSHHKQETYLYEYPCIELFCSQKSLNRTLLFGSKLHKDSCHVDYWNQPLNLGMCICYLVIHIEKPIMSIKAVLLPFVTYLLTLIFLSQLHNELTHISAMIIILIVLSRVIMQHMQLLICPWVIWWNCSNYNGYIRPNEMLVLYENVLIWNVALRGSFMGLL
jgi:hypothetical protein